MKKISLNNGQMIDAIGFGTYKITDELTSGNTRDIVRTALRVGYRYIDTAAFYQNEEDIGIVLKESGIPREELTIATKVWKTDLGYEKTRAAIRASLQRLQLDYADIYLIHWPKASPEDPDWRENVQGSWKAMEEAVREGLIRMPGLSNFLPHHMMAVQEVMEIRPVLDQLELHAGYMQQYTVDYCRAQGILPQAWSPLGRTRLFAHPTVTALAEKYGVPVPDLLLRFLLQQGIGVIPKATTEPHMRSNMAPAEFTLSEEDLSVLLTLPRAGWAGEHPDFTREAVDFRFSLN